MACVCEFGVRLRDYYITVRTFDAPIAARSLIAQHFIPELVGYLVADVIRLAYVDILAWLHDQFYIPFLHCYIVSLVIAYNLHI